MTRGPIFTAIPGGEPIELVAYYEKFAWYYPNCEPQTKSWFARNVGADWVVFDCGANIGYFSILFARLAPQGHVYCFEPTETHEMLVTNLKHHRLRNVTALRQALNNRSGRFEDSIYRIWGQAPEKKVYSFTTIDKFCVRRALRRVDCIKIDVDSFDFEVLQGAEETLARFNPYVMVELNRALRLRNQTNTQALEWLAARGYEECVVFDYDNFLLRRGADCVRSAGAASRSMRIYFPDTNTAEQPVAASVQSAVGCANEPAALGAPDGLASLPSDVTQAHAALSWRRAMALVRAWLDRLVPNRRPT